MTKAKSNKHCILTLTTADFVVAFYPHEEDRAIEMRKTDDRLRGAKMNYPVVECQHLELICTGIVMPRNKAA